MLAAITTDGDGVAWIMRPITAATIAATIGGGARRRIFRGRCSAIPLDLSANSPHRSPGRCGAHSLQRYRRIRYRDLHQAAIEMNDAPTSTGRNGDRALFPRNLFGVRVSRWLAYLRAQTGAVTI